MDEKSALSVVMEKKEGGSKVILFKVDSFSEGLFGAQEREHTYKICLSYKKMPKTYQVYPVL